MIIKVFYLKRGYTTMTDIIEIKRISIRNNEDNNLYDVAYYDMDGEKVEYTRCEIRHPDHFSTIISNKEEGIVIELNQDSIRYNDWEDDDEYYL